MQDQLPEGTLHLPQVPCKECPLIKGAPRIAYTAVVYGKGFCIGKASEGIPGYQPMKPYIHGSDPDGYQKASAHADQLNRDLGLDPKEAYRIILSTMVGRKPQTTDSTEG